MTNLPQNSRVVFFLLWLFASPIAVYAKTAPTKSAPLHSVAKSAPAIKVAQPRKIQALLWKISSPGGSFYLTGTIHVGKPDFYPLSTKLLSVLQKAEILVVEADITNAEKAFLIGTQQFLPEGETLTDWLPSELVDLVAEEAEKQQFSKNTLLKMKPVMAGITLTMLALAQAGYQAEYGIDRYLIEQAKNSGKTLIELEGIPAQLALLDSFTSAEQKAFLTGAIQEVQTGRVVRDFDRMVQAWRTANLVDIERYSQEAQNAYPESPRILEKMVWGRHPEMLRQLETLFKKDHFNLVAVGSLHLVGKHGLLALLRQAGYKITPIYYE